ncbi:MAG: secretin N-terminal domain-containing protein [Armatimonadia bacterium]
MRRPLLVMLLLALPALAMAQGSMRLVRLNFADATQIAAYFGGGAAGGYSPAVAEAFARDTIVMGLRRLPAAAGQWQSNAYARSYPGGTGAIAPPAGLSQPPVAIPAQNALMLRGTPDAMDRMEEIIAMLDKPAKMVNIELAMLDAPEERVEQWGLDFRAFNGSAEVGSVGNAPAAGAMLRWGIGNVDLLFGMDDRRTRGREETAANVTTFNNAPATVSFGETLPFFVSHVTYDVWGNRHVDVEPYSIFTGVELYVLPRINSDDSVTMRLVPTIVEAAGAVTAPDGSSIPITRNVMTDTQVRVRNGEAFVIGGMRRMTDSQTERFRTALGETKITRSSNPVLVVTPNVIQQ